MKQSYSLLLLLMLLVFCLCKSSAQETPGQEAGYSFSVDLAAVEVIVDPAPNEDETTEDEVFLDLPSPIGEMMNVTVRRSNLLSDELDAAYPGIKTYILGNAATGERIGRMVVSPRGVDVVLRTTTGLIMIEPDLPGDTMHTSYFSLFAPQLLEGDSMLLEDNFVPPSHDDQRNNLSLGTQLLSYELAVIADGEYSQDRGNGTESSVVAAVAADVSALNVIYERDLSIRLMLSEIQVYLDPDMDIFPNAASAPAGEAVIAFQDVVNEPGTFTYNDFDIGHVFSGRGGGSSAFLNAVCRDIQVNVDGNPGGDGQIKGGGGSRSNGLRGATWIGLVAHEMGHQFGASHTFNGDGLNCAGDNYNASTAYEIGSGSTIMSYANICGNDNLAGGKDLYFHINSIEAIYDYTRNGNGNCATVTNTGNTPPTVNANPANASYTIPRGTPFVLTGTATDPNAGQELTYTWEQYDLGTQGSPGLAPFDTGEGDENGAPLFRSFEPSTDPTRSFPSVNEVLGNLDRIGEVLPFVGREMNFRLVVRDNNAGGGGVTCDEITLTVDGEAGPFELFGPQEDASWMAGATRTVAWEVANTDNAAVNCQNVRISLSTDGGQSFPIVLAESTPNDGLYDFTVPAISTTAARIKVEAVDNIFYDISDFNTEITSDCNAEAGNLTGELSLTAEAGDPALDIDVAPNYGTVVNDFTATLDAGDPSVNLHTESTSGCQVFSNPPKYEVQSFQVDVTGSYTFSVSSSFTFGIANIHRDGFDVGAPCATLLASNATGISSITIRGSVTAALQAGQTYQLVMTGFSANDLGTITVTPSAQPTGSRIFTGTAPPGGSFDYRYIITDTNDEILAIQLDADLSNDNVFPEGDYTVYGLSVSDSQVGTLSTYVNDDLSVLVNGILNGDLCADLSGNTAAVAVTSALPVELLHFTADNEPKAVRLKWGTSLEIDNDYFVLERSTDGRTFSPLAEVAAAGNSNLPVDYEYLDERPVNGKSYYRLIQVDADGTRNEEGIVAVQRDLPATLIEVFPNPVVGDFVNIRWDENTTVTDIQLLDAAGRLLVRADPFAPTQNQERWQLPNLTAGLYLVRLSFSDGGQRSVRLVKQ